MLQVRKRGRPRINPVQTSDFEPVKIVKYDEMEKIEHVDSNVDYVVAEANEKDEIVIADVDSNQEKCFVCGESKQLIYCDFPSCTKAYHYMCVVKTCSNDFQQYDINDSWYCPRHLCTGCNALQQTNSSIHTLLIPKHIQDNCLSSDRKNQNKAFYASYDHIIQKPLKFCDSCPLSLCNDCELEYRNLDNADVFSTSTDSQLVCGNCVCDNDVLLLARKLEAAWSYAVRNLISYAVPFLRPLLPLIPSDNGVTSHGKSLDLLEILENIRKLKYSTISMLEDDLAAIRDEVVHIAGSESKILSAYNSLIECMTKRLSSRSVTACSKRNRQNPNLHSIWRKECERAHGGSADSPELCIPARSIEVWTEIITNKVNSDNVDNPLQSILRAKGTNFNLNNSIVSSNMSVLYADTEANRLSLGMEGKAFRETVTLQEDCTENDNMFKFKEYLANDEGIVVLDRLQSVCSHALHLGLRMEEEYSRSNLHLIPSQSSEIDAASSEGVTSIPMLTVSELKLIKELKLSNDNLKWCIEQRKKVFDVNRERIKVLEGALQRSVLALEAEEKLLLEDKNKVSSYLQFKLQHSNTRLHP